METFAPVLIVFLVIIFVVLIFGATRYYGNPAIASPLPLREPQIDPENELDLYISRPSGFGLTTENIVYEYKNITYVFQYLTKEFNFSNPSETSLEYSQSNMALNVRRFRDSSGTQGYFTTVDFGNTTVGIINQLYMSQSNHMYAMIKTLISLIGANEWIIFYNANQNLERYSNEFRVYPTIMDPVTNGPYDYGIISSINFNYTLSVEIIPKVDKVLRIRMRTDNNIQEKYPEITTNAPIIEQDEGYALTEIGAGNFARDHSGEIIQQLFP